MSQAGAERVAAAGPSPEDERRRKEEKWRRKRAARKARRAVRAGRASGARPTLRQRAREYQRAAILRIGKRSRRRVNASLVRYSRVGDPPIFDRSAFPWMAALEEGWCEVRAEAEAVLEAREHLPPLHEISPDHDRLNDDGRWKSFILMGYGIRSEFGCGRCPRTAELLESVPGLETAFFSILAPGSHLPRHRGPTKAIITWHLGLIVPEDRERCWIEVKGQRRHWEEGRSLVFDDASKHEVRNDTDEERVVLLMHFRRPLRFPGSLLGRLFLGAIRRSPFIRDAHRNQLAWERAFARALAERAAQPGSGVAA